jgi:probable HAF family extracellular repeat protein
MNNHRLRSILASPALVTAALASALGCGDRAMTAPDDTKIETARASSSGGGGPQVNATDPDTGFRNTTIDVQVLGSGFDQGSQAVWALKGDTTFATTRIKTNATRFVSSKKLIANITIGSDAPFASYDVAVLTSGGKKGIGLELFVVTYHLIDLGTLGGVHSEAHGINSQGQVVGWSETASGAHHAFLWTAATGMQDLGTLGGTRSDANDVNDNGQVVGTATNAAGSMRGFIWTAAGRMRELSTFGGSYAQAFAVNAVGDVGGQITGVTGKTYPIAAIWTGATYEEVEGTSWSYGVAGLNDVGQAAAAGDVGGHARPFFYTRTAAGWTKVEIPAGQLDAQPRGTVNNAGQVVGYFRRLDGGISGFVWSAAGGLHSLPSLVPGGRVDPYDINGASVVAGFVEGTNSVIEQPAVWTPTVDGGWTLQVLPAGDNNEGIAFAVNERGDVAGWVHRPGAARHAAIWLLR